MIQLQAQKKRQKQKQTQKQSNMGHFTAFYTELFGENPSYTLKTPCFQVEGLLESCVERQEEMS